MCKFPTFTFYFLHFSLGKYLPRALPNRRPRKLNSSPSSAAQPQTTPPASAAQPPRRFLPVRAWWSWASECPTRRGGRTTYRRWPGVRTGWQGMSQYDVMFDIKVLLRGCRMNWKVLLQCKLNNERRVVNEQKNRIKGAPTPQFYQLKCVNEKKELPKCFKTTTLHICCWNTCF